MTYRKILDGLSKLSKDQLDLEAVVRTNKKLRRMEQVTTTSQRKTEDDKPIAILGEDYPILISLELR